MEILKRFFKKKEKRMSWIPWSESRTPFPSYDVSGIPSVRKAIAVYADLLKSTDLVAEKPNGESCDVPMYLLDPCPYMSREDWYDLLVENLYVDGNFLCFRHYIDGQLKSLPPFRPQSIYAYAKTKNPDDPIQLIEKDSYYYMSEHGDENNKTQEKFLPEMIFHIKRLVGNPPDQLNGLKLSQLVSESVNLAMYVLTAAEKFAKTNFISPKALGNISSLDEASRKSLQQELEIFLENRGSFLTLGPNEISFNDLIINNPANLIMTCASLATNGVAQVFNLPPPLVSPPLGHSVSGGYELKETHKSWLKFAGKAFLEKVSNAFTKLAIESGDDVRLKFLWKQHWASDFRESATALSQLMADGIITQDQVKEWLA